MELVHKYTDFTELTAPMIYEFVDKIIVHEADKSTGEANTAGRCLSKIYRKAGCSNA